MSVAGTCSITGALCTFPPQPGDCGSLPGPLAPSGATCSTGGVGGVSTATLRNDAGKSGVVCRRNNKTSGAYTSGGYDYPSGKYLTPITNGTGDDACTPTNHYVATPRHYWKAEAQWCEPRSRSPATNGWAYGTGRRLVPVAGKDSTHIYPTLLPVRRGGLRDNYTLGVPARRSRHLQARDGKYTHTWIDSNLQSHTITRTFDQDMTNYANWFAYYRTRIQAVKTVPR